MSRSTNIKHCRYAMCNHGGSIDVTTDKYVMPKKGYYYHTDCFNNYKTAMQKDDKTKKDLQYIRNQWVTCINKTVVYSELNRCLNDLLLRGVSSDFMVFTLDYVIDHHLNLNHPMGFKYYIDKGYIRKAYQSKINKMQAKQNADLPVDNPTDSPSFKINKPKPYGFSSILRGDKR